MAEELKQQPDYVGHRARLRERFLLDDGACMPDYELLELLLTYAIPRRDVKPIAKKLLKVFGSLERVLHAPTQELREKCGITDNTITLFHLFISCNLRISSMQFADSGKAAYSVWQNFIDYCNSKLGYKEIEESWAFFFNTRMEFIKEIQLSTGTMNHSSIPLQKIIYEAIKQNAFYVVLAHNHPSGICAPSEADKALTAYIAEGLKIAGLSLFDHIVVTSHQHFSFRANGYIETEKK
jgi:DNA repair protein RadC